ncbi:MAG: hypothetical protein Q8O68_01010 [Candidatus Daviesbacteria bacterium]|nr:hypothetical protein [Candidatus Daviesbacteria bacterium]
MERIVKFSEAYDKRNVDPSKNYGVGGVNCWMILKGGKGAVQFAFSTGIYLPHVLAEWNKKDYYPPLYGIDVGYHSPEPIYEGQPEMGGCDLLPKCYYDGSSLLAEEWFRIFTEQGGEAVWLSWKRNIKVGLEVINNG